MVRTELEGNGFDRGMISDIYMHTILEGIEWMRLSCVLFTLSDRASTMYGHTYSKSKDRPGKVANPAGGQLNRKNNK